MGKAELGWDDMGCAQMCDVPRMRPSVPAPLKSGDHQCQSLPEMYTRPHAYSASLIEWRGPPVLHPQALLQGDATQLRHRWSARLDSFTDYNALIRANSITSLSKWWIWNIIPILKITSNWFPHAILKWNRFLNGYQFNSAQQAHSTREF